MQKTCNKSWPSRRMIVLLLIGAAAVWGTLAAANASVPGAREIADANGTFRCHQMQQEGGGIVIVDTKLGGVPAILRVPRYVNRPPIVLWHGFGPPASKRALMNALPLDDVPALKVYLGLPLFGARAPIGGNKELLRRQTQDFAMLLFKPAVVGAADELPSVVAALRRRGCMRSGDRIGLFGFSAGGVAVLIALARNDVAVSAAVLLNASTGLKASIRALERVTKRPYAWTPAARLLADHTDAVRHASDIARGDPPTALLIIQGDDDTILTSQPAKILQEALRPYYGKKKSEGRLQLVLVHGMSHSWVDRPSSAAEVRMRTAKWFLKYR
ncbi:MAG: alpha/beta hydrolase family protein [Rhodanobacteraceae bacterium]